MAEQAPLSAELDLLCHCDLAADAQLAVFLEKRGLQIRWDRFADLVSYNAMGGLVAGRSPLLASPNIPARLAEVLEERRRSHVLLQLLQTSESVRLIELLARAGVSAIVLKGTALAHSLYAADPASRYSSDIDLLVEPRALVDAARVLDQAGYVAAPPQCDPPTRGRSMLLHLAYAFDFVHETTQVHVELHHRLAPNPHVLAIAWEAMKPYFGHVATPAGPLPALDGALLAGYLCWHALSHPRPRLKWLGDLVRCFSQFDSDVRTDLMRHASAWGIDRVAPLAAALARTVYASALTEEQRKALDLGRVPAELVRDQRKMFAALEVAADLETERSVARLPEEFAWLGSKRRMLSGARARRYEVLRAACDPRDVAVIGLERRWAWLYGVAGPALAASRRLRRSD